MEAACRLLTAVGVGAALMIGLPALFSWFLTPGTELWSSVTVLPYLGALSVPRVWAFFASRAAAMALRGTETSSSRRLLPGTAILR